MNNFSPIVHVGFGILFLGLIQSQILIAQAAPSARDLMLQNEERRRLDDIYSHATLKTGGKGVQERIKDFTWWKKLSSDKVHYYTLTRFHVPAEIRNEGILFLERDGDQNEVLMYLPNFKKIRRIENQQQSQSFMGSEFSYSDIATVHVDDYKHKYIKLEKCPSSEASTLQCHVIESIPSSDAVKERTGYTKSVTWLREDNQMGVKAEYYNLEGELFKRLEATQIKLVDPKNNKWMSQKIYIENLKNGHTTSLEFKQIKVNQGIPDAIFTQRNLSTVP